MSDRPKANRVNAMIAVIKKVSQGDYSAHLAPSNKNDEIDQLADEINLLIDRLGEKSAGEQLKKAEEARHSVLKAAMESIQDGMLMVLGKSKVSGYNAGFCQMWSIPNTVMAAGDERILIDLVLPQLINGDSFIDVTSSSYQSRKVSEDVLHLKDGRVFERSSYPLLRENKVRGRVWLFRDISERRQLETALRLTQFSYDRAPVGIFHTKRRGAKDKSHFRCRIKVPDAQKALPFTVKLRLTSNDR